MYDNSTKQVGKQNPPGPAGLKLPQETQAGLVSSPGTVSDTDMAFAARGADGPSGLAGETDAKALLASATAEASEAIERTRHMPSEQIKAISKIKAGYIKAKYGIDIIQ